MKKIIALTIFLIILCGCQENLPGRYEPQAPGSVPGGEVAYETNLFTTGETGEQVRFETNDPQYWSMRGYSLWFLLDDVDEDFSSRGVRAAKISGNASAGYGLVYCWREDAEYGETMLVVMLNTRKEYIVAEITGGDFREIIPWTESPFLNMGYNQNNVIRLEYDEGEDLFSLYLNNQPEATFREEEEPVHTGGRHGYMVVISPLDDFPDIPVIVDFEEGAS